MIIKKISAISLIFAAVIFTGFYAYGSTEGSGVSSDEALKMMKEGNERFASGKRDFPNQTLTRASETAEKGQKPFVSILSCADSRVPVEHIFDAGIGDLFVIRVAGNVADTDEIGTIEYGVGHLGTPLLVVLGHTKCGAVTAVVKGDQVHGSIPMLVDNIVPAVERAKAELGATFSPELVKKAIDYNVWQAISDLFRRSKEAAELVSEGKLKVAGAIYNIETGKTDWLGEHPDQRSLLTASAGNEEGHGSGGKGEGPSPWKIALFSIVIILIYAFTYMLLYSEKRLMKKVQIKGRLMAGPVVIIITLSASIFYGASFAAQTAHPGLIMMAVPFIPAVLALIFSLMFVKSIINSFKKVINYLKAAAAGNEQ